MPVCKLPDVSFARQFTPRFQIFMDVAAAHSSPFSDADAGLDADSAMRKVEGFCCVLSVVRSGSGI